MSNKIDFTTLPSAQMGELGSARTTSTTRVKVGEIQISNLNTNWEYLVFVNYGLFSTTAGYAANDVSLSDITVNSTGDCLTLGPGRIRGSAFQSSPSWVTTYTPPSSSLTLNVNGYHIVASGEVLFENVLVKFVPLRRVS